MLPGAGWSGKDIKPCVTFWAELLDCEAVGPHDGSCERTPAGVALLAMAALLTATPVLAACGASGPGRFPYVAEFRLGADTPEARMVALTPMPGLRAQMLPEPSQAPRTSLPDVSAPFLRRGRARSGEGDRLPVLVGLPRPVEVHGCAALSHATASLRGRY